MHHRLVFLRSICYWCGPAQYFPFYLILCYIAKHSYFVGIGPICYIELTCILTPPPPLSIGSNIGLKTMRYFFNAHIFQMLLSWHLIMFYALFGAEYGKCTVCIYIYIYITCINTQRKATAPFDNNLFVSPPHSKHWKTEIYRLLADRGEGDRDFDLNCLDSVILRQYNTVTNQC